MKFTSQMIRSFPVAAAALGLLSCTTVLGLAADAQNQAAMQRRFDTPQDAVKALATATQSGDRAAVDAIFGPDIKDLLSGDPKQDTIEFAAFAKSLGRYSLLVRKSDNRYVLNIGSQNWPMPVPLVRKEGKWFFDTEAGKDEIINRRVGKDELNTIGVCRAYVSAQREYAADDRDGTGILKYAQKLRSTKGSKDGLYWKADDDEDQSPLGPLVAEARAEGYGGKSVKGESQPFHGYLFKILTAQGADAPGGAYNYVINGNLIAGFALVAYPAHWGESGVMTFIVNQWGKVYQRNLGADSAEIATAMTEFNPDSDWAAVASP
jgi:hypothetical protein